MTTSAHQLNLEYRDTDRPTDVISLEYKPETPFTFEEEDLAVTILSWQRCWTNLTATSASFLSLSIRPRSRRREYGHSFEREMGFLAVHGFLHINGYDHYRPEEEKEMFTLQEEILTAYGLTRQ